MHETSENQVTAALTFIVPQKVGWSVQRREQSWTGKHLAGLADCLGQVGKGDTVTLSISLIFELNGSEGTEWSPSEMRRGINDKLRARSGI